LDVLNDVSLTIEALTQVNKKMSPILSKKSFYGDKNLLIQEEVFSTLADHRDYLQKKYFEQTSFSQRIKTLEEAQERVKLLTQTMPKRRKEKLSTTMGEVEHQDISRGESLEKGRTLYKSSKGNLEKLEKL
jgi:hypothetical protein